MKQKYCKQIPSFVFCIMLIVAMAFFTTGCNGGTKSDGAVNKNGTSEVSSTETAKPTPEASLDATADSTDTGQSASPESESSNKFDVGLGKGNTTFYFTVVDRQGKEKKFEIYTDKKTVGDALSELKLIDGEEGDYGLYVITVNGITVDYDKDGSYWAFYIGDDYAQTGVDSTEIKDGESYSFKVQK